jgi:zinc protease
VETQLRPDRATLIVVGDVEPGPDLLASIKSKFGGWSAPPAGPRVAPPAPPPREARVLLLDRPGAKLARLLVGLRTPTGADRDDAAFELIRWRLQRTLENLLRVAAGATYGVHVALTDRPLGGALVLQTAVDSGVAGDSLQRLLGGVEVLSQGPLPAGALARARWQVASEFALRFDTVDQVADALGSAALRGQPPTYWETRAASIASLTPERVRVAAATLVGHEVVVVVGDAAVVGPQLKDSGFDFELLPEAPPGPPAGPAGRQP